MSRRLITTMLVALALVGLLGACGNNGGPDNTSGQGEEPSAEDMQDAILDYAECMRDHGVNIPDPEFAEDGSVDDMPDLAETGASPETIAAAEAACQPILDAVNAGGERPDAQENAEILDQMVAVTECMRAKGYDMGDPRVDDQGQIMVPLALRDDASQEQIDQHQADLRACEDEAGVDPPDTEDEE